MAESHEDRLRLIVLYVQPDVKNGRGQSPRRLPRMGPTARRRKPAWAGLPVKAARFWLPWPGRRRGWPPRWRWDRKADDRPEAWPPGGAKGPGPRPG